MTVPLCSTHSLPMRAGPQSEWNRYPSVTSSSIRHPSPISAFSNLLFVVFTTSSLLKLRLDQPLFTTIVLSFSDRGNATQDPFRASETWNAAMTSNVCTALEGG